MDEKPNDLKKAVDNMLASLMGGTYEADMMETPRRFTNYLMEFNQGGDLEEALGTVFQTEVDEMVVQTNIPFRAMCIGPRTRVQTPSGYKNAYSVSSGDTLMTLVGGFLKETKVKQVVRSSKSERLLIHTGGNKTPLQLSAEHPLMTQRGWVRADEVTTDDKVAKTNPRLLARNRVHVTTGYSLGYVLGAIAADGFIESAMHKRRCTLRVISNSFAGKYSYHLKEALGLDIPPRTLTVTGGFNEGPFTMYSVQFFEIDAIDKLIKLFGGQKRWHNHKVPDIAKTSPEVMQGYMDGYFDGDGSQHGYSRQIITKNEPFTQELHELGIGGIPQLRKDGSFSQTILKKPQMQFTPDPNVMIALDEWPCDMVRVEEVSRQTAKLKRYTFYDFACEPYPSFLANGITVHNCAHHLLPFFGEASIGYIPTEKIVGLSKLARLVQAAGVRKPSMQETITDDIVRTVDVVLKPRGVMVVVKAEHTCMAVRGIVTPGVSTITSAVRGVFRDAPHTRIEFFELCKAARQS